MDSNGAGSVQYDRWNEDNINMNVEASQSSLQIMCVGSTGIVVKAAGAAAALVAVYIIGYMTGYYIHRCP
uniref:Small integral membrane protein 1 n=1 Tax=Oreochromis niloticus TaxID=8128 RepID=A0A669CI01_ORENI